MCKTGEDGNWLIKNICEGKTDPCEYVTALINTHIYVTMKKFRFPPQKFKECCSLCAAEQHMAASDQGFVWLLTPERCREGGCECVRPFGAGGQPNNNKGPALSLSPVIFQLSEKLLWRWKKVKLKSLAWYVLTTACRMCNTSKYFLSSHSRSLWTGNCPCVCNNWAGHCSSTAVCGGNLTDMQCDSIYERINEPNWTFFSFFPRYMTLTRVSNAMTCVYVCLSVCVQMCSMSTLNTVCPL